MKKLYLQLLYTLSIRDSLFYSCIKTLVVALLCLGFSNAANGAVSINTANVVHICRTTAVDGHFPSCTLVPTFYFRETLAGDFASGADNIVLHAPAGFQFCTGVTPTVTASAGDFVAGSLSFTLTTTTLSISFSMGGTTVNSDRITIANLNIQPLTTGTATGYIYASSSTGLAGITVGAGPGTSDFADLNMARLVPVSGCFMTGGGISCTAACPSVGTTCSVAGFTWQLYDFGILTTCPTCSQAGTGGPLDFGAQCSSYAVYSVRVTDPTTGCWDTLLGNELVIVNGNPLIISTITGGGPYCSSDTCPHIKQLNSEVGVNYQLNNGSGLVGPVVAGTGGLIDFGPVCAAGTYFIVANRTSTSCTDTMLNTRTVSIIPPPAVFTATGGGAYCASDPCPHITVSGSNVGVDYRAYCGASPVGSAVAGTGSALDLGPFCAACTYSVIATDGTTGCRVTMSSTAAVSINPTPTLYVVSGGGTYCSGGVCPHVRLSGSNTGINYTIFVGATPLTTLAGTGAALDFGPECAPGIYTVVATNTVTGCTSNMISSATVSTSGLPTTFNVVGGGTSCPGGAGSCAHILLDNSELGVNYQVYCSGTPVGSAVAGTGGSLDFGPQCVPCVYTILATNAVTGCQNTMAGSATITTLTITPITGSHNVCLGATGILSNATSGGTWSSSNTAVATISTSGVVTGVASGTSVITYLMPSTCYATFVVTVPSTIVPAITGGHSLCAYGAPDTVCNSDTTTRLWSSTGVTVDYLYPNCVLVTPYAAGVGTITYTSSSGCFTVTTVAVNPLPCDIAAQTVCQDQSATFSSCPPGGTWTSSNTAVGTIDPSTGVATGISAGSSIITYTTPSGCYKTSTLTVKPLPAPITGLSGMCLGLTDTLYETTPLGTWSSSNTSVATVGLSGSPVIVNGVSVGTATITYRLFFTGCYTTYQVTVNPLPTPITGPTHLCVFDSITLANTTSGGTWSTGTVAIDRIDTTSGVLHGLSYGTATVTYTIGIGCNAYYAVRVDSLPAPIIGDTAVCIGRSIHLIDTSAGSSGIWTWLPGGSAYVDVSGFVTGLDTGMVSITYTNSSTGCYVTDSVRVNQSPGAITGTATYCIGDTSTLMNAVSGGIWISNYPGVASIDSLTGLVTGNSAGTATISYKLSTGCASPVFVVTVYPIPAIHGPTSVCAGLTLVDTASPAGGVWSTSYSSTIITLSSLTDSSVLITAGYVVSSPSITYTIGGRCSIVRGITINGRDTIVGKRELCLGDTTTLSNAWLIGGGAGTWYPGDPSVDTFSTIDNGLVYGIGEGTSIITFTNSVGCSSYDTLTVHPFTPIFGDTAVCVGSTITLYDTTHGGFGIWSTCCLSIDTVDVTGNVFGVSAGISIISYALPTGCIATYTVTVNPLPDPITGPTPICQYAFPVTYLVGTTTGGTWTVNPPTVASIDPTTGLINAGGYGTAVLTYTLPTGCLVTDTITIDPNPLIGGASNLCLGFTGHLTVSVSGGTWSSSDITVVNISSGGFDTGLSVGTAVITYTRPTGCIQTVTIVVNPLPDPITGVPVMCKLETTTLFETTPFGHWTSTPTTVATVDTAGVVTGVSAGTAVISFTIDTTGCYVTDTVLVNPLPNPITGAPGVCITFDTLLRDTSPGGLWSVTNTYIDTININTGRIYGLHAGLDTVYYTFTATGCKIGRAFTVYPPPTVVATPDHGAVCVGQSDTVHLTGAVSYAWAPSYALSNVTGATSVATPSVSTTYTVIGTSFFGCKDTITFTLVVDTLLNHMKVIGRDSICIGTCDTLMASGRDNSHYAWHPARGLNCTICDTVVACPDTTTSYTAVAIDAWGCRDSLKFTVKVNPLPILTMLENPTIVCKGTPKQLYAFGAWSYIWTPPYFLNCDTCSNPIATDTINMVYKLVGTSRYGCKDSIDVRVSVLDTNVDWASRDTIICIGGVAQLHATSHSVVGNLDVPSYQWIPAFGLDDPSSPNPKAMPDVTTVYSVIITENVCFKDTIPVIVRVDPIPDLHITPPSPQSVVAGTAVQLTAITTNDTIAKYFWSNGISLSCDTCFNPVATPSVNTTYHLVVISDHGCTDSADITINIFCDNSEVFVPNTFTPNGDGVNDLFYVSAKGISLITRFSVYNRWGELVFQANNILPNQPGLGWDGTYKGYVLEPDVFVYIVDAVCELGSVYHYKGDVSIVR